MVCHSHDCPVGICLCHACMELVRRPNGPMCPICGREYDDELVRDHLCGKCVAGDTPYGLVRSIAFYEDPVKFLLQRLKYQFDTATLAPLCKIAQSFDFSPFEDCDVIVPVPLHRGKLRKRGMNQALVLARSLFPSRKRCIQHQYLYRKRETRSQTQLGRRERKKNIRSAFSVQHPEFIINKKICLVDDIFTTGATVAACSRALSRAGASEVRVLTMARVGMPR